MLGKCGKECLFTRCSPSRGSLKKEEGNKIYLCVLHAAAPPIKWSDTPNANLDAHGNKKNMTRQFMEALWKLAHVLAR